MNVKHLLITLLLTTAATFIFSLHQKSYALIQFEQKVDYEVGSAPTSVTAADFNNDQKMDLAVTNSDANTVSILLGNGDGTFQDALNYPTGETPEELVVSDFNADGHRDLAVANSFDDTLSILLGKGDGSFEDAVSYEVGITPYALTVADLNGDSNDDLATANLGTLFSSGSISLILGKGDGTFQDTSSLVAGSSPTDIYSADFNGDEKQDLVVTDSIDNTLSLVLGNGDGTFQPSVSHAVGQSPFGVTVGDFNHDLYFDSAVANSDSHSVSILLGNGNGTLQPAVNYGVGTWPIAVVASDFDHDGMVDLAVANSGNNTVSILKGGGSGTFQLSTSIAAGEYPYDLTTSDVNGDTLDDLVVVNNNDADPSESHERYVVSVLLNSSSTCPLNLMLSGMSDTLALLRNLRDTRLALTTQGKRYIDLYYQHSPEVITILMKHQELLHQAKSLLEQLLPVLTAMYSGKSTSLTQKITDNIESLLNNLETHASPALRLSLNELEHDIKDHGFFDTIGGLISP